MITQEEIEQLFLARYYYSYGKDYLSDVNYEEMMGRLKKQNPNHYLCVVNWSEDTVPIQLLNKHNLPYVDNLVEHDIEEELPEETLALREEYFRDYEGRFSGSAQKSIKLVQCYDEIYKHVNDFGENVLHASIKADGFNFTAVYFKGELVYGRTKGRKGTSQDITVQLRLILPIKVVTGEMVMEISGELVCYKQSLPYLRDNYKQKFKSTRSAISTLLHGGVSYQDIRDHMKALVFKVRSGELHSLSEEFAWAKDNNFNVPAHMTFNYHTWEDIMAVINYFSPFREELPYSSDGLVLGLDNNEDFYSRGDTDMHYMGNIAIKVGVWDPGYYVGIVNGIKWTVGDYTISPEAQIEPVLVSHGSHVQSIPISHVARMVEHDIVPGSEIYFKVTGDSKITLVHREDELEVMMEE